MMKVLDSKCIEHLGAVEYAAVRYLAVGSFVSDLVVNDVYQNLSWPCVGRGTVLHVPFFANPYDTYW